MLTIHTRSIIYWHCHRICSKYSSLTCTWAHRYVCHSLLLEEFLPSAGHLNICIWHIYGVVEIFTNISISFSFHQWSNFEDQSTVGKVIAKMQHHHFSETLRTPVMKLYSANLLSRKCAFMCQCQGLINDFSLFLKMSSEVCVNLEHNLYIVWTDQTSHCRAMTVFVPVV